MQCCIEGITVEGLDRDRGETAKNGRKKVKDTFLTV